MHNWLIVIPARLHSTRLPEKPLRDLGGMPLIAKVCQNLAPLNRLGAEMLVATDSEQIKVAAERFGYRAVMTRPDHTSGTDRIWEAAKDCQQKFIMNVQGDEPFVAPGDLEALARAFEVSDCGMGTLAYESHDRDDFNKSSVVKVVVSKSMKALYFSRAPIPHLAKQVQHWGADPKGQSFWHHQGVYGFRKEVLGAYSTLPPGILESTESLEQLRALENGIEILVVPASERSFGIDTPEDLEVARERCK